MTGHYSCETCKIEVKNKDESVQCDLCDKWNHVFCVDISSAEYEKLKLSRLPWYCPICAKEIPFSSLSNKEFNIFLSRNPPDPSAQDVIPWKLLNTQEILKMLKDWNKLFDHTENALSCHYLDINEYKKVKINEQGFSLLHLNISSLSAHINELKTLPSHVDTKFDVICISESRISKRNSLTNNMDIPGYWTNPNRIIGS